MNRIRPEIAKSEFLNRLHVKKSLIINQEFEDLIKNIRKSRILEIGGMGIVAEYLARNGNEVRLCEEDSLFFDYRSHVVPTSTVIRLNTNPHNLKSSKPYYDYVVIHSPEYEDIAKKMCKGKVFLVDYNDNIEEVYEQFEYNTSVDQPITKDIVPQEGDG